MDLTTNASGAPATSSGSSGSGVRGRGDRHFIPAVLKHAAPNADGDLARHRPSEEKRWNHDQYTGPQPVGSSIFIRNLPYGATSNQVANLFAHLGEIVSVQVDRGPLRTATVDFIKQDTASAAAERFHGHCLQGEKLKVSAKTTDAGPGANLEEDNDFWRKELQEMHDSKAPTRGDNSLRDELAEMRKRKRPPSESPPPAHGSNGVTLRRRQLPADDDSRHVGVTLVRRRQLPAFDDDLPAEDENCRQDELTQMKKRRRLFSDLPIRARQPLASDVDDDDDFWRKELAQMNVRKSRHPVLATDERDISIVSVIQGPSSVGKQPVRQRRGRGTFAA